MIDNKDNFKREPQDDPYLALISKLGSTRFELVCPPKGYKAKNIEALAEWIIMAGNSIVDEDGLLMPINIPPYAAWQIARMMQIAKVKVPK